MAKGANENNYMNLRGQARRLASDQGYAMAALLVTIAIMGILMTMAMPAWRHEAQREKEAELIFRAGQYVHAIELYKRKFANAYPPSVDVLIKGRFLRKEFTDPMTKDGKFRLLTPQELNATPSRMFNQPGVNVTQRGGVTQVSTGPASGTAGTSDNRLGSGTALTGQGLGSSSGSGAPMTPGAGGFGTSDATGPGGQPLIQGPIAAVASRSTDQSIRIFKGRDHYNEWIVTIDDVIPRQFLRPQQPQPGQQPGTNPSRPTTPTNPMSSGPTSPTSSSPNR
jgi:type II secretory pathway pseudopilin PulG